MAMVILLRGVNVGGHRRFRPAAFAQQLQHLGAVNIGAAGTFVIPQRVSRTRLRVEITRLLPLDAHIAIVRARDLVDLMSRDCFAGIRMTSDMVRFVSVMTGPAREWPAIPFCFPPTGRWLVKVLAQENAFVVGVYRRHMRVISYLGQLDRIFGVPLTTRSWNTIAAIARVLGQ